MMKKVTQVMKRDGSIAKFEPYKITESIQRALSGIKITELSTAKKLSKQVLNIVENSFDRGVTPTSQDIEDIIIEVLQKTKYKQAAKLFLDFRARHKESVGFRTYLGVRDELKLSNNALKVMAKRYLLKNEQGNIVETPARLFRRTAKAVASADSVYKGNVKKTEEEFFQMMSALDFIPNTPTLMNAGTSLGQLSACFVLPVGDSLKEIFTSLMHMALIQQSGGGTGFSFSKLRPKNDIVHSTKGTASGPLSFMRIFDATTSVIKQGGRRRGANMGMMNAEHPDIFEFVTSKSREEDALRNFNISVAVTDSFMDALKKDREIQLVNPRTKKAVKSVKARELFELAAFNAWKTGDPGMIFIDELNRKNPTPMFKIESTNPCGEQPLLPYESCNLGSINLAKMVSHGRIDWNKLKKTVRTAVHFLDNVIDANKYPVEQIEEMTKANRKIGLGIMGFADALIKLGIPYDSERALRFAEKLMKFIQTEAHKSSAELGIERGSFPNFSNSIYAKQKAMRNSTVTTIAPTGTISIIANASSGIEPLFAVTFVRDVLEGTKLLEVNPLFEDMAKKMGFYSKKLMMKIAKKGSVRDIKEVPKDVKRLFVTAFDIKPEWHVKMQAVFQKYTDNAVSKTVNLPHNAKAEDVKKVYLLAHKLGCKGITVYRYGSKKEQVLYIGKGPKEEHVRVSEDYAGECPGVECVN